MTDIRRWLEEGRIVACPAESDFFSCWQSLSPGTPLEMAIRGGIASDRLAWVFMSGYQAALERCFPEFAVHGWTCFAAAEPKGEPSCELHQAGLDYALSGQKSWIAGAEHVGRLIVAVEDVSRFVCIDREKTGVSIRLPRTPSFLPELSQGAARFDAVEVGADEVLDDPDRASWFRGAEPLFVLLALNAFMAAHGRAAGSDGRILRETSAAISVGEGLIERLDEREIVKAGLAELRALTGAAVEIFVADVLPIGDEALRASWLADARLLNMFRVVATG